MIIFKKIIILWSLKAIDYMKSERKVFERLLSNLFEIVGHCVKECLFIADDVIVYQMVVHTLVLYLSTFNYFTVLESFRTRK